METISARAFAFYREHIADNPDILPYFEAATPVLEFELAKIGSRPARRKQSTSLDDLRAVITSYSIHYTKLYDAADEEDGVEGLVISPAPR